MPVSTASTLVEGDSPEVRCVLLNAPLAAKAAETDSNTPLGDERSLRDFANSARSGGCRAQSSGRTNALPECNLGFKVLDDSMIAEEASRPFGKRAHTNPVGAKSML